MEDATVEFASIPMPTDSNVTKSDVAYNSYDVY